MDADTFPAGLRVLAVEHDRVCRKVLERQLQYCNYNATMVMNAQAALNMLRERKDGNQFDLVISNVAMPKPNMDGFKLLDLIGLEMDLPVIMLSANSETQTIMKGIKHGACDYLIKPVRLEQLRGIWTHVVKNSKTDDAARKLPSRDGDKVEKVGANHTKKYSRKNKKPVDVANEDNDKIHKKQRVQWCGQLHQKFVQAIQLIGLDRAVPQKILDVMNVEGLTRENVASHLQKYRIFLRKLNEGILRNSSPFADETEAWLRITSLPSFIGSPRSTNHSAQMNSSSAIGTQASLLTESVQVMGSQKNLGIPQSNVEPVSHSVNLPKDVVPMPVLDISRLIPSGKSYAPALSGGLPGASQCFPPGPSGSSFANSSNGVVLNARKPFSVDISGSSFANISIDRPPLTSNMSFSLSQSCSSYASVLRGKILGSSRGIPFEDISDGEMLAPSGHLPLQPPDLVNQPLVQIQSCSAGQFNTVASEVHQIEGPSNSSVAVPPRFSDLGHNDGTSEDPTQDTNFMINQLSRFAGSSGQIPTFGNEYQNKITGIMGNTVPMVGFREQVATLNFGDNTRSTATPIGNSSLASSSSTRPDLQINNSSAMPTQVLNGGGATASDNLLVGSTVNQQAVSDPVNNINEFLMGTSGAHNGERNDLDDFLACLDNQDFVNNGGPFMDGDWEFHP